MSMSTCTLVLNLERGLRNELDRALSRQKPAGSIMTGDPTLTSASLNWLVHAYRVDLRGKSMCKRQARVIGDDWSGDPES